MIYCKILTGRDEMRCRIRIVVQIHLRKCVLDLVQLMRAQHEL